MILGKALRGLFLTLWLKGSIITLEKIMDLAWDEVVKYNIVFKNNNPNEAI